MLGRMGNDELKVVKVCSRGTVKVHRRMCLELQRLIDGMSIVFPDIESSRPRCQSGTEALCLLHLAVERAKVLVQLCSDSSKLYLVRETIHANPIRFFIDKKFAADVVVDGKLYDKLRVVYLKAISTERILSRCIKIQNTCVSCLSQIQDMVPTLVATTISTTLHELRHATFFVESKEHEAGKAIYALLRQKDPATSHSRVSQELKALQTAALGLEISTRVALIIEKRSIKKLLEKFDNKDSGKNKVLRYLLFLLKKYGESILQGQPESFLDQKGDSCNQYMKNGHTLESLKEDTELDGHSIDEPPGEFRCPISGKIMYDPVIIASGKSFERLSIEKWFNEGNRTCPVTNMELDHLTIIPNNAFKDLISKWCFKRGVSIIPPRHPNRRMSFSGSVASFESSKDDLAIQVSNVSIGSTDSKSDSDILVGAMNHGVTLNNNESGGSLPSADTQETELGFNSNFSQFPWGSRCSAVKDMKNKLKDLKNTCELMTSPDLIDCLVTFLRDAQAFNDVEAQGDGLELLLDILRGKRIEAQDIQEDAIYTIVLFLDSENSITVLEILNNLSSHHYFKSIALASNVLPSILKVLDAPNRENNVLALRTLDNMSYQSDISHHLLYLDCMTKLIQLLTDPKAAIYCIRIIRDLCNTEEGKIAVAEAYNHFSSIIEMLDTGSAREQEQALDILIPLCYECAELCAVIKRESVIDALINISRFGRYRLKAIAKEMLHILGCVADGDDILQFPLPQKQIPGTQKGPSCQSKGQRIPAGIYRFFGWRQSLL